MSTQTRHRETKTSLAIFMAAAVLATGNAQAATNTSSAQSKVLAPSLVDNLLVSYTNVFFGPPIEAPLAQNQPNDSGETDAADSSHIAMEHYVALGYKFTKSASLSIVPGFKWEPVDPHTTTLYDPYLKLSEGKLISSGNYGMAGQMRVYIPVSDASLDNNAVAGIRLQQVSTYAIPDSRFTLGFTTFGRGNINSTLNNAKGKPNMAFQIYGGPSVEYQLAPTVSLTALYEMQAKSPYGDVLNFSAAGTDFEPGISWDITPTFNFSPYVDIKSGYRVAADTTTIGWTISWKLL